MQKPATIRLASRMRAELETVPPAHQDVMTLLEERLSER
jgi:hypothetical protein